jgi:hypothetical protein
MMNVLIIKSDYTAMAISRIGLRELVILIPSQAV